MLHVVFVAPFFLPTTLRFVRAAAILPGVGLSLISQEPSERLPAELRARLLAHWRVRDALNPAELIPAAGELARRHGRVHRLIGALEELQVPLGTVRDHLGVPGMTEQTAKNFRDKSLMKTVLQRQGVPCARHRLIESAEQAHEFAEQAGFPLVTKPPAGSGSRQTFRLDRPEHLREYLAAYPPSPEQPTLLEQFLVGEEHSIETVTIGGKAVWHSPSDYFPTPLEVMREPWIQWCVLLRREAEDARYDAIKNAAERALQVLGMDTGVSHTEWFGLADGRVAISEVGARPPGAQFTTLISYAYDIDFYRGWAEVVILGRFDSPPRRFAAGAAYLRGQGGGRVRTIRGLDDAQRKLGPLVVEAKLPAIGQPASGSYEGEGYVILRHPETHVVAEGLSRLIRTVRVEMSGQQE
ncbi:MAG: ATP-grasp domain-containing protein [Acidobacteriota bacterium]|nr:MAG: ATP-grasp domain-containing protein [Acidobacteriota bacterium]